jgi:hypothetical protein
MKSFYYSSVLLSIALSSSDGFCLLDRKTSITKLSMTPPSSSSSGPRASGRRRSSRGGNAAGTGPKQQERRQRRRPEEPAVFDGKVMAAAQRPNDDAPPLDLETAMQDSIRCMTPDMCFEEDVVQPAFTSMSLDDLFGANLGFSAKFNSDTQFRIALRSAIRQDIFDTTPFYANLSEKAASVLLLPDSSLEGSWRMPESMDRMKQTTALLQDAFGPSGPTGDELFQAIGNLCGTKPTTHFIDIFGVQDRKIPHSWHLDSGTSPENSRTVLWGFPKEDEDYYDGCGVFSHVVSLQKECVAPKEHPRLEPVLFDGTVDEKHVIRPNYTPGQELIMYRDIDVIHSAPDVIYRASVMRFM